MAFFSRGFVLLWHGQVVSQLGNQAFLIATAYAVLEATGSPLLVAAVMVASTAPLVVLGPFGGTLADRHSRRAIVVLTDVARAIAIGTLGAFVLWRPGLVAAHVTLVIAIAAFSGAMGALFAPAVQAFIPDLVPRHRLAPANALHQISNQASVLVGQASGGLLYVAWGAGGLLIFDALTFAYAAVVSWFIPRDHRPRAPAASLRDTLRQYLVQTREGLDYVRARRGVLPLLFTFAGVNVLFMPVFVLLPFYVRDVAGGGPEWYGFLLAGAGAGALTGSAVSAFVLPRVPARAWLVRLAVTGIGCSVVILAAGELWLALPAFAVIGLLSSLINVTVMTTFQSAVPPEVRGRVMALVLVLSSVATPLGMAFGGVLGDLWRDSLLTVFAWCGVAIVALAGATASSAAFAELLRADADS
jgi:MFS transporter, DHA3 family, macrolide efflux protein